MQETRQDFRARIEKAFTENQGTSNILQRHNRQATGHPRKEVEQPRLLSVIINIVQASSATDNRRRTETLRSLTTLDDLHQELTNLGFKLICLAVICSDFYQDEVIHVRERDMYSRYQ